jgi:predicted DNA-binding protein
MNKEKKSNAVEHWKDVRAEKRLTIRFTAQLYAALDTRSYEESKTISAIVIEAVRKYLDFKMPPRPQ